MTAVAGTSSGSCLCIHTNVGNGWRVIDRRRNIHEPWNWWSLDASWSLCHANACCSKYEPVQDPLKDWLDCRESINIEERSLSTTRRWLGQRIRRADREDHNNDIVGVNGTQVLEGQRDVLAVPWLHSTLNQNPWSSLAVPRSSKSEHKYSTLDLRIAFTFAKISLNSWSRSDTSTHCYEVYTLAS